MRILLYYAFYQHIFHTLMCIGSTGPDFLLNSRTWLIGNKKAVIQVVTGTTLGTIIWALFSLLGLHLIFQVFFQLFILGQILPLFFLFLL